MIYYALPSCAAPEEARYKPLWVPSHERVELDYRAAGITTLLAKLEGDHEQQLATLQRLVAITQAA